MDATKILLYLLFGSMSILLFDFFFVGMIMLFSSEEKEQRKHPYTSSDSKRFMVRGGIIFGVAIAFIGLEIFLYQIFLILTNR